jgi:RNA recognition motif-containing protein
MSNIFFPERKMERRHFGSGSGGGAGGAGGRSGNDRNDEKDNPAMSRLFVLCSKQNTEEEFRESFSEYGTVEEVWIVKDRHTGENKGVAYVKFSKTSEAAKALEEMHGRTIGDGSRPIKVLVASSRQQGSKRSENEEEKYLRLFIIIPKDTNEDELYQEFGEYGTVDAVTVIRDKHTREGKGFAYIKFKK